MNERAGIRKFRGRDAYLLTALVRRKTATQNIEQRTPNRES